MVKMVLEFRAGGSVQMESLLRSYRKRTPFDRKGAPLISETYAVCPEFVNLYR